jgi:hypothetical protein
MMQNSMTETQTQAAARRPGVEFPSKAAFIRWLERLEPDLVVAERWSGSTCPLSMWLQRGRGIETPYVSPSMGNQPGVFRLDTGRLQTIPAWADRFAIAIDAFARVKTVRGETYYRAVTARDCLTVLKAGRAPVADAETSA